MNLLFYTPFYLPATRYGGPVRSVHGLAKALAARGHNVHVYTTDSNGPESLDVPVDSPVDLDGVSVWYFPVRLSKRLLYSPAMAKRATQMLSEFDLVHINGSFLWPGAKLGQLAQAAKVPVIFSPRGMLIPELISGKSAFAKRAWIRFMEQTNLTQSRAIHVASTEEARGLAALGYDLSPMKTVPNGVQAPSLPPSEALVEDLWAGIPKGQRVAFIGRLAWQKGVDIAIEAVRRHGRSKILIAGPDEARIRPQLESRLVERGRRFGRFTGELVGSKKWALLMGADVVLVPSKKESFGMSVVEALSVGTPVIAASGVGASEIIQGVDDVGVVAKDSTRFAEALEVLLSDAQRRFSYGAAAKKVIAERYSWSTIAEDFESAFIAPEAFFETGRVQSEK